MAISGWGVFLIILRQSYTHYRARRLGLPPPSLNPFSQKRREPVNYRAPAPAPGGVQGWISDKWNALRNTRTAGGAYESSGGAGYGGGSRGAAGHRAFGPLDPDEAWDARVDHETSGYYEEQELGLQDPGHGPYGGGGYGEVGIGGIEEGRGRSRSRQRELDNRYDEEVHGKPRSDPFGDAAEPSNMSLRAVSPRPHGNTGPTRGAHSHRRGQSSLGTTGSAENSPTERRSMFHEEM
nr:hypothetical protein CFP56_10328 [Quercus suber]